MGKKSLGRWRVWLWVPAALGISCGSDSLVEIANGNHNAESSALLAAPFDVQRALDELNGACDAAVAVIGEDDREGLQRALSQHVGWFWTGLYRASLPSDASFAGDDHPADAIFEAGVQTDMEVVAALFTPSFLTPDTPPIRRDVMLILMGDALTSLSDRLGSSVALHDFACGFIGCHAASARTETSELMAIMGSLDDGARLQAAVANSTEVRPEWLRTFSLVAQKHDWLRHAVREAAGTTAYHADLLSYADPVAVATHVAQLASVVQRCRTWGENYSRTGMFEPDGMKSLHSGIQATRNEQFKAVVALRKRELRESLDRIEHDLDRLVQRKRDALHNTRDTALRQNEFEGLNREMGHLRGQLKNLRLRITQDDAAFSDRVSTFQQQLEETNWDRNARHQIGNTHHMAIAASAARDDRSDLVTGRDVLQQDGKVWTLPLAPGDLVNVRVAGQWSPTCALQGESLLFALSDVVGAMTGPEGYQQQASAGTFRVKQVNHSQDHVVSDTRAQASEQAMEAHAGLSANNIPFIGAVLDVGVRGSIRDSERNEHATSDATHDAQTASQGNESRLGASFAQGIRSNRAPYPQYPVGSLLLVQREGQRVVQVDVMRSPHTAILAQGSSATFVVNDAPGCSTPPDALQVEVVNLQRVASDHVAQAMADLSQFLRERGTALQDDPALNATAPALQSEALALMERRGLPLGGLPPAIQTLFRSWLDKELLNFERKVAAVNLEHQIDSLALRAKGYADDLGTSKEDARLLTLLPYWSLRNLGVQSLQWKARALTDYIMSNYFPVLELFYPEVVTQLRGERLFRLQLNELLRQPWVAKSAGDGNSVGVVHSLIEAVTMVESKIADAEARRNQPTGTRFQVAAVSFPRPGAAVSSPWAKGDEADAWELWKAMLDGGTAKVTVRPEHLYSRDTLRPAVLECDMMLPVIRSMGVVFAVPDTVDTATLNGYNLPLTPKVGPNLLFTHESAGATYDLSGAEAGWRKPRMRRLFSHTLYAQQTFEQYGALAKAGDGLSPFTTLELDLSAPRSADCAAESKCAALAVIEQASEVILFFELETRAAESPMHWIASCR